MSISSDHPFCVDVRASRMTPGRFAWRIMTKGSPTWRSPFSYATFEEARREAKAKLDELVAAWRSGLDEAA